MSEQIKSPLNWDCSYRLPFTSSDSCSTPESIGAEPAGSTAAAVAGTKRFPGLGLSSTPVLVTVPTYDGSGQATHPSVVDLGGAPIGGFRYYMAFTPYPNTNSSYENPSIVASNDLSTWVVPVGATNPIVGKPSTGYNSDTHIINVSGVLRVYYRASNISTSLNTFYAIESSDGIAWTAPVKVYAFSDNYSYVCPVVRYFAGKFYLWHIKTSGVSGYPNTLRISTSADGITFSTPVECSFNIRGVTPWHFDILPVDLSSGESGFVLVANCYPNGGSANTAQIYLAESSDGVAWIGNGDVLVPRVASGALNGLYRPSIIATNQVGVFNVFFGAYDGGNASAIWRTDISLTKSALFGDGEIVAGLGVGALPIDPILTQSKHTVGAVVESGFVGKSYYSGTVVLKDFYPTLALPKAGDAANHMLVPGFLSENTSSNIVVDLLWLAESVVLGKVIRFRCAYMTANTLGAANLGGDGNSIIEVGSPGVANTIQRVSFYIDRSALVGCGNVFAMKVYREGSHANDTFTDRVLLVGVIVRYGDGLDLLKTT